jgi:hypothetical protein
MKGFTRDKSRLSKKLQPIQEQSVQIYKFWRMPYIQFEIILITWSCDRFETRLRKHHRFNLLDSQYVFKYNLVNESVSGKSRNWETFHCKYGIGRWTDESDSKAVRKVATIAILTCPGNVERLTNSEWSREERKKQFVFQSEWLTCHILSLVLKSPLLKPFSPGLLVTLVSIVCFGFDSNVRHHRFRVTRWYMSW